MQNEIVRTAKTAQVRLIYFFASYSETFFRIHRKYGEHEALSFVQMLLDYAFWDVEPVDDDSMAYGYFQAVRHSIDGNLEKMKQGDCGLRGGRPKKNPNAKPSPKTVGENPNAKPSPKTEEEEEEEEEREVDDEGCACADAQAHTPPKISNDEFRMAAHDVGVPETYIRTFVETMTAKGWAYINAGGSLVPVTRKNFKTVLGAFYRQEQKSTKRKEAKNDGNANNHGRNASGFYIEPGHKAKF